MKSTAGNFPKTLLTILATLFASLLMFNLSLGDKQIEKPIPHSYAIHDSQFQRTMGFILGPDFVAGNKIQTLINGEEIFPAMLDAIRCERWGPLLQAGVEIYEYRPTMYHVKMLIADSIWVSASSTNFDSRSFAINDEANLNIYDEGFAQRQIEVFEKDLEQSRRITLDEWTRRSWPDRALDFAASLLGPQL